MGKHVNRTGEVHQTKESGKIKIIEWFGVMNCTIQFEDGAILKDVKYCAIKNGQPRSPNYKVIRGVGYLGEGDYTTLNPPNAYDKWANMLHRCYSENTHARQPTYKDCSVDPHWHNFQNFAKWFEENYNNEYMQDWQLDKDILFEGNKVYSPETCCFVPREINIMINGSGNTLYIYQRKDTYYPVIRIKKKDTYLGSTKCRKIAVGRVLSAKKDNMRKVLNNYSKQLDDSIIKRLEQIIEDYILY